MAGVQASAVEARQAVPPHVEILSPAEAIHFPDHWYEIMDERHFWMVWRTRAFLNQLRSLAIPTDTPLAALEIGAGHGILRKMLEASTQWTVDAADLNADALFRCKPGRGRTALYNIHDRDPKLAGRYDAVILFDVIEHIENPPEFLRSAIFHLKPGGYVFINVPALQSLYCQFDVVVGHYRRYDKPMLEAHLAAAGVRKLDDRYWGMTMVPVLVLRKLLMAMRGDRPESKSVLQQGVLPPGKFADAVLQAVMQAETGLIGNAPIGTSLLYAGQVG